jgi:asparagine synthase (glutamine-hydrolysing)
MNATVQRMVDAQRHRGPDAEGIYRSPCGFCCLGHTRLAILDTSDAATQPMATPDGEVVIAYNGECYNHMALRDRLGRRAYTTHSDTESLLYWIAEHGAERLDQADGMFAFAAWSSSTRRLFLARDRFGIKPLYYALLSGGGLVFASEVRAILASGLVNRAINRRALQQYLEYGFVFGHETIVDGIYSLLPGHVLHWTAEISTPYVWRFVDELREPDTAAHVPGETRAIFEEAVGSHLISDVPIGAFLSGGVDSSAIVAAMGRTVGGSARCMTVAFPDAPEFSEDVEAAEWARACGVRHDIVPMAGADILALLPDALDAQDQPSTDGINTFVVSRAARMAGLMVAISGLGGDEWFGGYPTSEDVPHAARIRRRLGPLATITGRAVATFAPWTSRRLMKIADLLTAPGDLVNLYGARRRQFSPAQVSAVTGGRIGNVGHAPLPQAPDGLSAIDTLSWLDLRLYMTEQLLRDSDSMSMANSLEIRVPFLDNRFATHAWNGGASVRDGKRQFVRAIGDLVPNGVLDSGKRGFTMPFARWLTRELREMVEAKLQALPDLFDRSAVQRLWRDFLANPDRVGWTRPWALFCLASYLDRNRLSL